MVEKFKAALKDRGQSLRWFYSKFIKPKSELTYSGFTGQLNGYAPVNNTVKKELERYLKGY